MTEDCRSSDVSLLVTLLLLFLISAAGIGAGACTRITTPNTVPDVGTLAETEQVSTEPWPGQNTVITGDNLRQFGTNLSGLFYEPAQGSTPAVLWAALNGPGTIYRLVFNGTIWTFDTTNNWEVGKPLRYPNGTGNPDVESVTQAESTTPYFYAATERDNAVSSVSRLSILRFDSSTTEAVLTATHEWNLKTDPDLPAVGANLGLEAITWIPDDYLVSKGFLDEKRGVPYSRTQYPFQPKQ